MGQNYPLIRPGPVANPSLYPPFLVPVRRGLPEGRILKGHLFFLFYTCALAAVCQPYGPLVLQTLETMVKTTQKIFRHTLICKIHRPVFTTRLDHGLF